VSFLKTFLAQAIGPIANILLKIWNRSQAKQEGKDEAYAEQNEQQLRDSREEKEIGERIRRADDDQLNRWMRHPDERQ